jgi:hypothetical protein
MSEGVGNVMTIELSSFGPRPFYKLTLSRDNFDYLCANDGDFLVGCAENGSRFSLSKSHFGETSGVFRPVASDSYTYHAEVGVKVPAIPYGASLDEIEKMAKGVYTDLELAINQSGPMPIIEEVRGGKPICLGLVKICVAR